VAVADLLLLRGAGLEGCGMSLLSRRIRGFRLVDLVGLGLLMMIILGVYLAKTMAGRERAEIATIERQIKAEKTRIRLLQARKA
jgi:hypothetical protein